MRQGLVNFFALFTTMSTLLCCALPSLLVTLGAGAVVASSLSAMPWLVTLSHYKLYLFIFAGLMLALNFVLVYRPRGKIACATGGGKACENARWWNRLTLWLATGIYLIGLFMAYLLLPLRIWIGG